VREFQTSSRPRRSPVVGELRHAGDKAGYHVYGDGNADFFVEA
jgi:hypothetical protein